MPAQLKYLAPEPDHVYLYRPVELDVQDAIPEFSLVKVLVDTRTFEGAIVKSGSVGTIVTVWDNGAAYDVEFVDPIGVASVAKGDLCAA